MDSMIGMRLAENERHSPRVSVVRGGNPGLMTGPGTNTYLIGTGTMPILLDAGIGVPTSPPLLECALEKANGSARLQEIVVTHAHPDHLRGAAGILARLGDCPVSKQPWPGRDEDTDIVLTALAEGTCVSTEGATLRAIHTPGHSPDHLCFYLEEERALFTGDLILGAGTSVIPTDGGDMGAYMASLEKLLKLDVDRIYPGHGPPILEARRRIREYIEHRSARENQIVQAVRDGAHYVEKIVKSAYRDTPEALHLAAGQSVRSHLYKLEREGRAVHAIDPAGEERWALV